MWLKSAVAMVWQANSWIVSSCSPDRWVSQDAGVCAPMTSRDNDVSCGPASFRMACVHHASQLHTQGELCQHNVAPTCVTPAAPCQVHLPCLLWPSTKTLCCSHARAPNRQTPQRRQAP